MGDMSESQLDRMERKLDYMYDHIVKQTTKNEKFQGHLDNHGRVYKVLSWCVGVGISIGLFKTYGG